MTVNPDEVVAVGAAVQAAVLKGEVKDVLLLDVTPLSLGVETMGGLMTRVIERNTTIPARRSEIFTTAEDNQSAVDIVVLQGEREKAADNRVLAASVWKGSERPHGASPRVEVTFEIDANGILHVSARDKDTAKEQSITITETGNLDSSEVERMIAEAESHRAEDTTLRQKIDARNELRLGRVSGRAPAGRAGRFRARARQGPRRRVGVRCARSALDEDAPPERIRALTDELQQVYHSLGTGRRILTTGAGSGPAPGPAADDDVVDAEFTVS